MALSRAIRLDESGLTIVLGNGLDYPSYPAFREITSTIIKRKDGLRVMPGSISRSPWRQLASIAVRGRVSTDQTSGPPALAHDFGTNDVPLWTGALVSDKAKIKDVIESLYALPAGMFSEVGRVAYERGVNSAEGNEGKLIQAIKTHSTHLMIGTPPYNKGRQYFWTRVEQHLDFLFDLARDPSLVADLPNSGWGQAVWAATQSAYKHACPHQTPRQIEAFALGLRRLNFTPKKQPTPILQA